MNISVKYVFRQIFNNRAGPYKLTNCVWRKWTTKKVTASKKKEECCLTKECSVFYVVVEGKRFESLVLSAKNICFLPEKGLKAWIWEFLRFLLYFGSIHSSSYAPTLCTI